MRGHLVNIKNVLITVFSVMVVLHQGSLNGLDTDLVAYLALPCIGNFFLTQLTFSKQTTSLISKFLSEGVHPAKSSL